MKISQGPMIERYAAMIDIPASDVLEWINEYVNDPNACAWGSESTEAERFASIRAYIERRLHEGSTEHRIRCAIAEQKEAERMAA